MGSSLRQWLNEHREQFHDDGPKRCAMHGAYTAFLGGWYTLTSRRPIGRNVYDSDWDLLVVLDACRVDVLEAVADEYDFIGDVERVLSVGSHSREWLAGTFRHNRRDEIADTAMVTGNGHTQAVFFDDDFPPKETVPLCQPNWDVVDGGDFGRLKMVWQEDHGEGYGVPPRPITDCTIKIGREEDHDRLIAHYMQPHIPYIADAIREGRKPTNDESRGWKRLESGDLDPDTHWNLYEKNLRLVLDEVEILLENVDADRVAITADHGNAFGEFSIYGHPEGLPLPSVRKVPWVTTCGSDEKTFETKKNHIDRRSDTTSLEDHLQDLGYL